MIAGLINSFPRHGRFTTRQHRRWFFRKREKYRVGMIIIIYILTVINGIIFDAMLNCSLGVLCLLSLIGLLNDELSDLLYQCLTRILFPGISIGTVYDILYESRIFVNISMGYVVCVTLVMGSIVTDAYRT
jgi:hypothetical protein